MLAAAKATYVDRFVRALPAGYDTVIDEESSNLSRRREAADHDRARVPREPVDPDPRRGDVVGRHPHRGARPARDGDAARAPHELRDRAPAVDDPRRRPDPRDGARHDRRAGHARASCSPQAARTTRSITRSSRRPRPPSQSPGGFMSDVSQKLDSELAELEASLRSNNHENAFACLTMFDADLASYVRAEERLVSSAAPPETTANIRREHGSLRRLVDSLKELVAHRENRRGLEVLASLRSVLLLHAAKVEWVIAPLVSTPRAVRAVVRESSATHCRGSREPTALHRMLHDRHGREVRQSSLRNRALAHGRMTVTRARASDGVRRRADSLRPRRGTLAVPGPRALRGRAARDDREDARRAPQPSQARRPSVGAARAARPDGVASRCSRRFGACCCSMSRRRSGFSIRSCAPARRESVVSILQVAEALLEQAKELLALLRLSMPKHACRPPRSPQAICVRFFAGSAPRRRTHADRRRSACGARGPAPRAGRSRRSASGSRARASAGAGRSSSGRAAREA